MSVWSAPSKSQNVAGEMFRVEVSAVGVDLVWYLPNPHAGHEAGERISLEDFLVSERHQESVRDNLGDAALREILEKVRSLRA